MELKGQDGQAKKCRQHIPLNFSVNYDGGDWSSVNDNNEKQRRGLHLLLNETIQLSIANLLNLIVI